MESEKLIIGVDTTENGLAAAIDTMENDPLSISVESTVMVFKVKKNSYDASMILNLDEHQDHNYVVNNSYNQSLSIKKHKCTVCPECGHLVTASHFATHMNEMHYDQPNVDFPQLLCSECGIFCKDLRAFKIHMRKEHFFKCKKCPAALSTEEELKNHEKVHKTETLWCDQCEIRFDTLLKYVMHANQHEANDQLRCVTCPFVTTKRSLMRTHVSQHVARRVYTCDICSKTFIYHKLYKIHCEMHAGVKQHCCEYCPKGFYTKYHLKIHRDLNHHRELYGFERSYDCKECGRSFKFEKSLKRHLSCIHKIGEDRTVSCPVCCKKIANNYNLKVHMRQHTGEMAIVCETCGRGYSTYKSYKKHVLSTHPGVMPVPKNEPKALA